MDIQLCETVLKSFCALLLRGRTSTGSRAKPQPVQWLLFLHSVPHTRSASERWGNFIFYFWWCLYLLWCFFFVGAIRFPCSATPPPQRTHNSPRRDMEWALEYGTNINGVSRPPALLNLSHFDMARGQTVDYMHCLLLGVAKQLTETLLSPSDNGTTRGFYIGEHDSLCHELFYCFLHRLQT